MEELHPERTTSQTPFIQVMFVFQNAPAHSFGLPGLTSEPVEVATETAKFDLTLFIEDRPGGLTAIWEYNLDLFDAATIKRMSGHFGRLLEEIATEPGQQVSQIPLLTDSERKQLLVEWNNTQTDYPRQQCVHELFEEQARLTPEAIALTFGERHLTYQELNTRANQLAHHLRKAGVKAGTGIGVCLERSLTLVVGLVAILKAGGGYVAFEPNLPKERLAAMLNDLRTPIVYSHRRNLCL